MKKKLLISFFAGVIFAIGLVISGMTNPSIVRGFLNVFGDWNLSLAFVMLGAVAFNFVTFKKILKVQPWCATEHSLPTKQDIDRNLIIGSCLFGVGWGILGICPGPGIVNLVTGHSSAFLFIVSLIIGMVSFEFFQRKG